LVRIGIPTLKPLLAILMAGAARVFFGARLAFTWRIRCIASCWVHADHIR
jgi:hypothetical protein